MLNKLSQLQGVNYKWINQRDEAQRFGFIAQEVEPIFPEFVQTNQDGYKSVAYGAFTPVIIEAVKELNLRMDDLQTNVALSTGQGSEGLFSWLLDKFSDSGVLFEYEALKVKNIEAEKVKSKKVISDSLEMRDADTGEDYCVKIRNGEWEKVKGTCGETSTGQSSSGFSGLQQSSSSSQNSSSQSSSISSQSSAESSSSQSLSSSSSSTPEDSGNSAVSSASSDSSSTSSASSDATFQSLPEAGQAQSFSESSAATQPSGTSEADDPAGLAASSSSSEAASPPAEPAGSSQPSSETAAGEASSSSESSVSSVESSSSSSQQP